MNISPKFFTALLILLVTAVLIWVDPIPQDLNYHLFADGETKLGVSNFWNVMSNVPFLIVGFMGVTALQKNKLNVSASFKLYYWVFFVGIILVGLGSAWYHLEPNNQTLVWDRLPMTIAFMAFFAVIVAEHVDEKMGKSLFWPLLLAGLMSIVYWQYSESIGAGDLRWYALVQFLPLILIPLIFMLYPRPYSQTKLLWLFLGMYVLAKLLEHFDGEIFRAIVLISGHSLKHIAAAIGIWLYYCYLSKRT
ncbi:MAG: ceramidase domain-containing protein [Marinicella sp.]